jgi:hypothetical protein
LAILETRMVARGIPVVESLLEDRPHLHQATAMIKTLAAIPHRSRAIFFMVGALVFYCLWLWLLLNAKVISADTSATSAALLLLAPLIPVAIIDLTMRLAWQQEFPTLYPPPPKVWEKLIQREYGLYWFPVLICVPLWLWVVGLLGWIALSALQ